VGIVEPDVLAAPHLKMHSDFFLHPSASAACSKSAPVVPTEGSDRPPSLLHPKRGRGGRVMISPRTALKDGGTLHIPFSNARLNHYFFCL
jgi:hypothetical protein